jgi:hypothetical protein
MALTDWDDGVSFTGLSADTAAFYVLGGRYAVAVDATFGGGSVTLQILMPDGTTYVSILPAFTAAGAATVDLPPGSYKFDIVTATAVQGFVVRVPYRAA